LSTEAKCRLCGSKVATLFVDRGKSRLCETFLSDAEIDRMGPFYPLRALVFGNCFLVQLKGYVGMEAVP
jgi:Putative zinc binding domain